MQILSRNCDIIFLLANTLNNLIVHDIISSPFHAAAIIIPLIKVQNR